MVPRIRARLPANSTSASKAHWSTYGLAVARADGALMKHFAARL